MLKSFVNLAAAAAFIFAAPAMAQVQTIDPNQAGQYQAEPGFETAPGIEPEYQSEEPAPTSEWTPIEQPTDEVAPADAVPVETVATPVGDGGTVPREDVFTAAEGLFGRGAEGLGGMLENILRDQGEPTAYISGQEAGGAFVFGVRYGSGTMHHQVEGERAVYWTGPSLGFDFGADANKVFVLVYNLHDSQELFKRFPGAEGHAYFVGGFTAQYLRRGDVVLIPIRLGVGVRLGVNAGYMRFSERNRWVPF
ncbi:MAG: DUF1134 domain-containing protein [Allosphingosinicella sp.]